jgi:uroporphyrinogen decarboxylase
MPNLQNDNFLRACWRKETDQTPIWFMRQAGRYMESYRKIRSQHEVLEICKTPTLSAKVTLDAASALGVDAAILFADIMLPLEGIGVRLKILDGGPSIEKPVRSQEDVDQLGRLEPEKHVGFVLDAVRLIQAELDDQIPLIGFSGAPFTLASYLIEGGPSRDFTQTKKMMYTQPETWSSLLTKLSEMASDYLLAQIRAGVDAVQLFDSWSGCLSASDYEEFVLPYTRHVFDSLAGTGVPRIHFGVGTSGILKQMSKAGGEVFGVDWRIPIDDAWNTLGPVAIQGNLDPAAVLGSWSLVEARSKEILARIGDRPGHIFNLGHGVLPETRPEQLQKLVKFIHDSTTKKN